MAYALNLNPNQMLGGSLPVIVMTETQMKLSYYSGASGVSYSVQASSDLANWSTSGVTLSAPDSNQIRTASVDRTGPLRFMRIVVSN